MKNASIARRLIVSVLLLELLAAVALIVLVSINERRIQYRAFDATLRGISDTILGAVQDAEDEGDNVMLDLRGLTLPGRSIYRVTDEHGRVLGSAGELPPLTWTPGSFQAVTVHGHSYRFFVLAGERIIDPGKNGGVQHYVTVILGLPDGHLMHEVAESVRFYAIAALILLSGTAFLLVLLIRKFLSPIVTLAASAEAISVTEWKFEAPAGTKDFVELRPLALAVEKSIERLHRSFEQQKRFTSDAAHELKTDLAIIKSSLQLLAMKPRTIEEHEQGLQICLEDLTRLEQTVLKMLALARLELPQENQGQSCWIHEALEDVLQQSQPYAELKHIRIMVSEFSQAKIQLDRHDASLLCSNILLNALQHSADRSDVEVKAIASKDAIEITVRDHGEGIPESDFPFLFEPFYRGDPSRSRKSGGTGLGLSICKAICDRIGGSITIANHPEGGAAVRINLPAVEVRPEVTSSVPLKA